jgi:hypothetical protein
LPRAIARSALDQPTRFSLNVTLASADGANVRLDALLGGWMPVVGNDIIVSPFIFNKRYFSITNFANIFLHNYLLS